MKIDKELIIRCKKNEPAAQKDIYTQLLPYLNAICKRYLNDLNFRQDILQETFIKIFTKVDQFDFVKGGFHSWAVKILVNACLQHNAKFNKHKTEELSDKMNQIAIRPEVIKSLTDEDLITFLKTMPVNYYNVFNLYTVDGYSHQEIANMLNIEESLSRQWLSRAKAWLKKHLDFDADLFSFKKYSKN